MNIFSNKRGKVFYRYLLSYIPILMIPIILSFALFNKSQNILNKEADRANELLLGQMTSHLDMIMGDVNQLYTLVSYNLRLEGLMYESIPMDKDDYYRTYLLSKEFNIYNQSNKNLLDFYVFIPGLNLIVTPDGTHQSENYINYWLPKVGITYEEWQTQYEYPYINKYKASQTETLTNTVKDTISITYPLRMTDAMGVPRGWLTVHVDMDSFREIFHTSQWTDESLLIVYHDNSGVVTSSDTSIPFSEFDSQIDLKTIYQNGKILRFRDRDYIIQIRNSDSVKKLKYVSLAPVNIYRDQFISLTRFALLLFLFTFLIGSYLIYRFSVARYKPIHQLLDLLTPSSGGRISLQSDEFALISKTMEMTMNEDKQLKEKIKQSDSILAQRMMKQLFKGTLPFDQTTLNKLSVYGIDFLKPFNCLILVDIELDEEADPEIRDTLIQGLWFEGERSNIFIIRDLKGAVGFLLNHDANDMSDLYEIILKQKNDAEAQLPLFMAIGISNVHPVLEDLSILYTEAEKALEFRLVKGRKLPISFSEVKTSNRAYYYPINIEVKLINSIKAGDRESAGAILEDVYQHNFTGELPNLEIARCLMFDLISTMIKTLNDISMIEEDPDFWDRIKPITTLMNCLSFDQLRVEMGEILERVCVYVIQGQPNKNDRLKADIIHYIEINYRDKNLSPELIASHLHRNKAYLCRFFKDLLGFGISTYIKKHRIDEAKKLMTEENLSVTEISNLVGFSGSNSFIRAFKEFEGITPGQYMSSIFV